MIGRDISVTTRTMSNAIEDRCWRHVACHVNRLIGRKASSQNCQRLPFIV
jgi:hypothetical protein